ncbi:Multidrug resistance protein MdtH [subsurface metagenome]
MKNIRQALTALWRIRLLQFFFYCAFGAGIPFFSLYYKKILIMPDSTPAHYLIGLIFFIQALLGIVATPFAGFLADKFKIENRLLTLFSFVVCLGALIIAVPGLRLFSSWSLQQRFLTIMVGVVLNGLFVRPIVPLIDTETLGYLHEKWGNSKRYGSIRVFGAVGWIISASLFGAIIYRWKHLNIPAVGYSIGFIILALIALSGFRVKIKPARIPWDFLQKDKTFKRFLVFSFILTLGFSNSFIFTSYFFDDVKVNYLITGLALGLASICEIPVLLFNKSLLERIGNRQMIITGSLFQALKLVLVLLVIGSTHKWLLIFVQCLTALGFSLHITGMINLIDRLAHPDLRSTYQSLFHISMSLATASGCLFASFILKNLNSSWLMGLDSLIIFVAIVYFIFSVRGHGPDRADNQPSL